MDVPSPSHPDCKTVFVKVEIKPDRVGDFLKAMKIDADGSNKEPGCIRFDVHKDAEKDNVFYMYESYKDSDAAQVHRETEHYAAWAEFKKTGGVENQTVVKMNGIWMGNVLEK